MKCLSHSLINTLITLPCSLPQPMTPRTEVRAILTSLSRTNCTKADDNNTSEVGVHRFELQFQFHVLISEASTNEVQRRMRSPWYQLVLIHIMPCLCCPASGSWLQLQCLWLHLTGTYCIKPLPAEDSQTPTKILASVLAGMVIMSWWHWCILGGIQQGNVGSWKHFSRIKYSLVGHFVLHTQCISFCMMFHTHSVECRKTLIKYTKGN